MGYVFLGLAIIACVAGSSALTASDGMVIKKNGALGVLVFAISYVLLSRSILTINISNRRINKPTGEAKLCYRVWPKAFSGRFQR